MKTMSANVSSKRTQEEVELFLSHLSEASFRNRIPLVVCLTLVGLVGCVGNTLVLLVYGLRFKPGSTRVFVLFRASLDLITNIFAVPLQIASIRYAYNADYWRCRSMFAFSTLSTQASGFLLALVALDRVWRVCAPLRKQLNSRHAFRLAFGTVCATLVVFVPFVPYYGIHRVSTTEPGIQARMCWLEDEYKHTFYPEAHKILVGVTCLAGLAIVATSYACIGIKLWKKRTQRVKSLKIHDKATIPKVVAPGTVNPEGQQNQYVNRVTYLPQSVLLSVTDTVSGTTTNTEDSLSNSMPFNSEAITKSSAEQPDSQLNCTAPKKKRQTDTEESSDGVETSSDQHEQKKRTARERMQSEFGSPCIKKSTRRMRSRTTLMMAVLTLCYIINWLPHLVTKFTHSDPVNWCDNFIDCGQNTCGFALRSFYLNSAVNAFVYSICNQRFRQKCRELFSTFQRKISTQN